MRSLFSSLALLCILLLLRPDPNVAAFAGKTHHPLRQNLSRSRKSPRSAAVAATSSADTDLLPEIREAVIAVDGAEGWKQSVRILSELFASSDEAELVLADAFRWKSWALASDMLRRYQKPVVPDATKVKEALEWLRDGPLDLTDGRIRSNILSHPQIYLVEPEKAYEKMFRSAPRKYRNAAALKFLIENDPTVLQVWYNCDGEGCQSECGSCWLAYENRLPSLPNL